MPDVQPKYPKPKCPKCKKTNITDYMGPKAQAVIVYCEDCGHIIGCVSQKG